MRLPLLILFAVMMLTLCGQEPNYINYSIEHGLPSAEIYQVYQSSDNHIWIATDNGISRFDGSDFVYYSVSDSLINRGFVIINEDDHGVLRFVSVTSNIYVYNEKTNRLDLFDISPQDRAAINEKEPCSFLVDAQGNFQIGFAHFDGSATISSEGKVHFNQDPPTASIIIQSFDDKLLYRSTDKPGMRVDFNGRQNELLSTGTRHVNAIRVDSVYAVLSLDNSVYLFKGGKLVSTQVIAHTVIGLSVDHSGMLWIGHLLNGVSGHSLDGDTLVEKLHFLKDHSVSSVQEDHEGGHWFSTLKQGLYYAPNISTAFYDQFRGASGASPLAISGNESEEVLATYTNGSYTTFRGDSILSVTQLLHGNKDAVSQSVYDITYDKQSGCYWLSCGAFFKAYQSGVEMYPLPFGRSRANLVSRDGVVWSAGEGLMSITPKGDSVYSSSSKLSALAFDLDSNILAISEGGLMRLSTEGLIRVENPLGQRAVLRSVKLLNDTLLIFVNSSEDIALVSPRDTLFIWHTDEHDSKLIFDCEWQQDGYLWLNSNKGTERINVFEPEDARLQLSIGTGVLHQSHISSYIQDHHLWISTNGGMYRMNIEEIASEAPPMPRLVRLEASAVDYPLGLTRFNLPAQVSDIRIALKAITFKYADAHHLEYKMSSGQEDYRSLDGRELYFNTLEAGNHILTIRTVTESGLQSEPLALRLNIPQVYWKSWWFFSLIALGVMALSYAAYRVIVNRIQRKEQEKSKTKELINSLKLRSLQSQFNPHFTFNAINSIQNHISKENLGEAQEYLRMFSAIMRSVLINTDKECIKLAVELEMLDTYLKLEKLRFGEKLNYAIRVDDSVDPDFDELPPFIMQPLVENAINYGVFNKTSPGFVEIRVSSIDDTLVCTVTDDGVGRDEAMRIQKLKKSTSSGKGIMLVKERLELLNKRITDNLDVIDLKSSDGKACGTQVIIKIEQGD